MAVPVQLPTVARDEVFAGVKYHIEGELVPVLSIELQILPVYFENHVLLWKDPKVEVGLKSLKGAFQRRVAGMPIFMTEARGPGRIAFSRDGVGHVFPIHLEPGQAVDVREHQFLASTGNLEYTFTRVKGFANMLFGGTGFFIDTFSCRQSQAVVWLHGYGNFFEVTLQAGEKIDIEPGGWIHKDPSVQMETVVQRLTAGLLASGGQLAWNRFTGPGCLGLQSMYMHLPSGESAP